MRDTNLQNVRPAPTVMLSVLLGTVVFLTLVRDAEAQASEMPDAFTITFDVAEVDEAFAILTAWVGDQPCGTVDLGSGETTLEVGGPGAPAACNDAGRIVDLYPEGHSRIAPALVLRPGEAATVEALMPFPTTLGGPGYVIMFEAPSDALAALLPITAFVDGVECGASVEEDGTTSVQVGEMQDNEPARPDVCYTDLAPITLVAADGHTLFVRPTLHLGAFGYTITNLNLTDDAPPAPTPAEAGHAPILPKDFALPTLVLVALVTTVMVVGRRCAAR